MSLSNKKVMRSSSSRKAANKELAESGRAIAQVGCFHIGGGPTRLKQPLKKLVLEDKIQQHNMSPPKNNEEIVQCQQKRQFESSRKESQHFSANSSKIGASVINGRDRSACRFSAMKIHTEQTLKNRNGVGEDNKSPNSNINRFMGDNKMRMETFNLGENAENNHYSNIKKNMRNFPLCNSACSDDKPFSKSSESIKSSINMPQQRQHNISNFQQLFQPMQNPNLIPQPTQHKTCRDHPDESHLQNRQSLSDLCGNINLRMTHTLSFGAPGAAGQGSQQPNHLNMGGPMYFVLEGEPVDPTSARPQAMMVEPSSSNGIQSQESESQTNTLSQS